MTLTLKGALTLDIAILICRLKGRHYRDALRIAESLQRQIAQLDDVKGKP